MEKAYKKYKDSGVEWIGEIPESWHTSTLKYYSNIITGNTPSTKNESYFSKENGIPWVKPNNLDEFNEIYSSDTYLTEEGVEQARIVKKGSVLVGGIGNIGKLGVAGVDLTTNQQIHAVEFNDNLNDSFGKYLMHISKKELESNSSSVVVAILTKSELGELKLPIPSPQEQTQIAAYLDYHTGLIDELIAKKETLIQKLQEQRQAIINEAVTKGLNKDVALKDSGIEWLGEIPEHWEVVKLKFLGESITGITYSPNDVSEKGTLVLRSSNIQKGKLDLQDTVYVNKKIADKYVSQKGDILLCSRNGSRKLIGKNIILDEQVENETWGAFMTVYRSNYNDFIYYFFNSDVFSALSSLFLSSTINQLTIGVLNNMQIAFPKEKKEREQIVHYLKQETEETNTTIYKIQTSIQKLKDYRQSLISEAVTGKIDVRDWQEPNN